MTKLLTYLFVICLCLFPVCYWKLLLAVEVAYDFSIGTYFSFEYFVSVPEESDCYMFTNE
jgi:hypothetical protein